MKSCCESLPLRAGEVVPFRRLPINSLFRFEADCPDTRFRKCGENQYHTEGGGFVMICRDPERPAVVTEPLSQWRPGRFHWDDEAERGFPGYWTGARWNGWATPAFELEVALQIAAETNALPEGSASRFQFEDGVLIHDSRQIYDDPEAIERIAPFEITVEGRKLTVYDLSCGWTWTEQSDAEELDEEGADA